MNDFYPTYKSKLKPWIKWWILKRLNGGQSSLKAVTLSEGTLTKVDKSKALRIKEYYGNTVQDGTPTPDSPVEIQTISGENTFTINSNTYRVDLGGKNLLNIKDNLRDTPSNGITAVYNNDNSITISGQATLNYAYLSNAINCTLPIGTYTLSIDKKLPYRTYINCKFMDNTSANYIIEANTLTKTFTTSKNIQTVTLIVSDIVSGTTYNETIYFQLEEGNQATEYSPYVANPIELCKIGNYQDKLYYDSGKWYIEKKIGKVVLNGTETWNGTPNYYTSIIQNLIAPIPATERIIALSNNFLVQGYNYKSSNNLYFHPNKNLQIENPNGTYYATVNDWKTWLSTHNTTVYYVLATPTTEEITNTNLILQLNALYEFYVQSSTVSISNDSEIPFKFLLEYYGR